MTKEITEEQIKSIQNAIFELNIPVKVYSGILDLFNNLPVIKPTEEVEKKK